MKNNFNLKTKQSPLLIWWDEWGMGLIIGLGAICGIALIVLAFLYETIRLIFIISLILAAIGIILYFIIDSIKNNFIPYLKGYNKMLHNISKLPLTKEEFYFVTEEMTISECFDWIAQHIKNPYNESIYTGFYTKSKYAGYILQYYILIREKYKYEKISDTEIPSILKHQFACVTCDSIGIQIPDYLSDLHKSNNHLEYLRLTFKELFIHN